MTKKKLGAAGAVAVFVVVAVAIACLVWNDVVPASAGSDASAASDAERSIAGVSFPVNENGQTYGGELEAATDEDGVVAYDNLPDLIAVVMPDGSEGYMTKDDYASGVLGDDINTPEEATEWVESGGVRDPLPIYAVDGQTQIGWWVTKGGVSHAEAI